MTQLMVTPFYVNIKLIADMVCFQRKPNGAFYNFDEEL